MYNKNLLAYFTVIMFSAIFFYLSGIQGVLQFIFSLVLYCLFFYLIYFSWIKIKRIPPTPFLKFFNYFLWKISILLLFLTLFIGWLSYLSNQVFPAPMPEYTISNGVKTVKFQAMSHIGTINFYDKVKENLMENKSNGYVYFFEGVKSGTDESLDKFNQAIGIKFDENLYENFSKLYGVTNQDNRHFLGLVNNKDYNVDVSMDEIIHLYELKMVTKTKKDSKENKEILPIDANKMILETLSQLNERELKVLVYVNQAILNFIIGNEKTQNFLSNNFSNKELFEVILGERNKVVANSINDSIHNKIYTTYGLLHFKGVLELLQEKDPNWKIIKTENLYPIKN